MVVTRLLEVGSQAITNPKKTPARIKDCGSEATKSVTEMSRRGRTQ